MRSFTVDDLKRIMLGCAGMDDAVEFDGTTSDVSYAELGYDSLAILEIQSNIQQQFGVPLGDDVLGYMRTPADTVSYVNKLLGAGM
jgi:minimal PKS acyl carrier protein